ncbi:quinol:cytochrome C oxidoreductase [Ornithobacterium rhinotracheale]
MYTLSPKIKTASLVSIVLGIILFAIGATLNASKGEDYIVEQIHNHPQQFEYLSSSQEVVDGEHANAEHSENHTVEHLLQQYHNRPWTAFFIAAFLFTGIAAISMFFLATQHVSQAGWAVVVTRVMEAISAFMPYGTVMMLIVLFASGFHFNHLYHWMVADIDFKSEGFDSFMANKAAWLNVPFWLVRSVIYLVGWTLFGFWLRNKSKKLDQTGSMKDYWSLYRVSVYAIVFFALTSMASGWDWVMSLDPHWYSTLFGWYVMVSYLVGAVAFMILIAVYLKKAGYFPEFNDNHLHDLAKYLFAFSLLWGYLWLCQFELIWYANIPEESVYFQQRDVQYTATYYTMLIPNVVFPFLALISSSIKRNYTWVAIVAVVVILGHWVDIFNQMMPATVGPWWNFGFLEFGAFFFVLGVFAYVVMNALTKAPLVPKGNPLLHESEVYEYPF